MWKENEATQDSIGWTGMEHLNIKIGLVQDLSRGTRRSIKEGIFLQQLMGAPVPQS